MPPNSKPTLRELGKRNQRALWREPISVRANLADDITHNKYGELVIKISIPHDQVDDAIDVRRLVGLPITVTFQLWDGFTELINAASTPDGRVENGDG